MIRDKNVVALIPARAGSKGLPGKNTLQIGGRPLIAWSISAALDSAVVDEIIVTSDDQGVLDLATDFGVRAIQRPRHLASDHSLVSQTIRHAIGDRQEDEVVLLLQPTSPLRTARHIDEALTLLKGCLEHEAVVSVCQSPFSPELLLRLTADGYLQPIVHTQEIRRQDTQPSYLLNGAIYAARSRPLARVDFHFGSMKMMPYIMPIEDSADIDDVEDFEVAKRRLKLRGDV